MRKKEVLLITGLPATGKTTFGRYLAEIHHFKHYDLEREREEWPYHEDWFKALIDISRAEFIAQLFRLHKRAVLTWGFPVQLVSWVREMQSAGALLVWFHGPIDRARKLYIEQPVTGSESDFDRQVRAIEASGLPQIIDAQIVSAYTRNGEVRAVHDPAGLYKEIFGRSRRLSSSDRAPKSPRGRWRKAR